MELEGEARMKDDINSEDESLILDMTVFNTLKNLFSDTFSGAVESHTNSALENIRLIEEALKNNKSQEIERAAHSLKGASGQFGAMNLSFLSEQMEMYGKEGELEKAKNSFIKLKEAQKKAENAMLAAVSQT